MPKESCLSGNEFADSPIGHAVAYLGEVPTPVLLFGPVLAGAVISYISGEFTPVAIGGGVTAFFAILPFLS